MEGLWIENVALRMTIKFIIGRISTIGVTSNATDAFSLRQCGSRFCPDSKKLSMRQNVTLPDTNIPDSTIYTLMGAYVVCGVLAIVVIFFFMDNMAIAGNDDKKKNCCNIFVATFVHMKDRKMQLLIPVTVFIGLEQGFAFADFTKVQKILW